MRRRLIISVSAAFVIAFGLVIHKQGSFSPPERWSRARVPPSASRSLLSILPSFGSGYDATNVALYGTRGELITISRASTQTCEISAGVLTSVVSNKPCVESGALKVEPSGTNLLLQSEGLSAAPWADNNTPTVTANTWDFGIGSATGETIDDNDAALSEGRAQSVATTTTGLWTGSCYFQSGTLSSARLFINVTGGTGSGSCTFSGLSATTSRQSCTVTVGTGVTALTFIPVAGALASDTGSIKVGGCQLETGSVATSYIPTAGATASRAAQTTTVPKPAGLSTTEGSAKVCVTPKGWSTTAPAAMYFVKTGLGTSASTGQPFYTVGGSVTIRSTGDGTTAATIDATFADGVRKCYRTSWSVARNQHTIQNLTSGASNTVAFAGFAAFDASVYLGGTSTGTNQIYAAMDGICLSASPDGCR
jgi:hypothetical protein